MGNGSDWRVFRSHNRIDPSLAADTIRLVSGLKATLLTAWVVPVDGSPNGWPIGLAVRASHSRTVPSSPPEAILPSLLNATVRTSPCPVGIGSPATASHTRTDPSALPDTIRVPSRLNTTLDTCPWCPVNEPISVRPCAFHTLIMLSALPEAIWAPSGLN